MRVAETGASASGTSPQPATAALAGTRPVMRTGANVSVGADAVVEAGAAAPSGGGEGACALAAPAKNASSGANVAACSFVFFLDLEM
jgi:hypothetical protein